MAALDRFAAQPRDCSDDFDSPDLRMSQLLLCADSLHLWRAIGQRRHRGRLGRAGEVRRGVPRVYGRGGLRSGGAGPPGSRLTQASTRPAPTARHRSGGRRSPNPRADGRRTDITPRGRARAALAFPSRASTRPGARWRRPLVKGAAVRPRDGLDLLHQPHVAQRTVRRRPTRPRVRRPSGLERPVPSSLVELSGGSATGRAAESLIVPSGFRWSATAGPSKPWPSQLGRK